MDDFDGTAMPSRGRRRRVGRWARRCVVWPAVVVAALLACTGCWTDLASKTYPRDFDVVLSVERWRTQVTHALMEQGLSLEEHLDLALVVMACESHGIASTEGGGLYQFTDATWYSTSLADKTRRDAHNNIAAMAEVVADRGWRDWAGGVLSDGTRWGSGPYGHACWRYP